MTLNLISPDHFIARSQHIWDSQWLLLTSGDYSTGQYNAMTVGWGSIGYIWRKPFVQVVVRPVRYTFEFMEKYPTFTLCAFPEKWHSSLQLLGTKSGRSGNKIQESGLTPVPSTMIAAPGYAEAELVIECQKIYWDDFKPKNFLSTDIDNHYPLKDYHRFYFGEILAIYGESRFHSPAEK